MKKPYDVVVVIPIGPKCLPVNIRDTISSFIHYTRSSYKIVLADDSQLEIGLLIKKDFPQADVVATRYPQGKLGGLYVTLSLAYRYILKHYTFTALLRMDTDALIIGEAPEQEAIALFKNNPSVGMAGQYPLDYEGRPWDISWPLGSIKHQTRMLGLLRRPITRGLFYILYKRALRNGYKTGESVFGGACFVSEACLGKIKKSGMLPNRILKSFNLEEDHLFSVLAKSAGFHFGDLSGGSLLFACAWKGLPASPEELYTRNKKVIHSVRFWKDWKEADIRNFFRKKREEELMFSQVRNTAVAEE